jgi:hypothetical protein
MLGIGALVAVALVVVLISVLGGGSSKHASTAPSASGAGRTTTSGTTTSGTTPQAQVVAQVNLNPPSAGSAAKGVGFVVKSGSAYGIIIQAQHIAPNNHNAYAAWLYNSPTDASFLGFVKPGVGKNGQLQTGGGLPTNAGHFKQLLLALESGTTTPKSPGTIVLQGPFSGVPATG